jgi:hypothetical protein
LLHPEFHEVGRSGRDYDRDTVVTFLASLESQPVVVSQDFGLSVLSPDVALLTYRSAHQEESQRLVNHTLRSSLWLREGAAWQLRYHQGTPAAETW